MSFFKLLGGIIDRFCIVLGAFIGSQIPAFIYQYTQRLAGHVGELERLLKDMQQNATMAGKSLDEYIQKFLSNSDPDFVLQGQFMKGIVIRWEELSSSYQNLTQSALWTKPFIFLKNLDYDLAKASLSSFQPHLSLTIEGIYYTFIGVAISYSLYQFLSKFISKLFCRFTFQKNQKTV